MGLFDRLKDRDRPDPEELPLEERPYSHRPSPQGWTDRVSEWPEDKLARFEVLFPYPSDAVDQLAALLAPDLESAAGEARNSRLQGAFVALQALRLERGVLPDYKGTYGVFLAWAADAPGFDVLLAHPVPAAVAQDIGEELRAAADPELAELGTEYLRAVLARTRPGEGLADLDAQAERAREVQRMMFRRVTGQDYRDPAPQERFPVSGLAGQGRPAAPVDPDAVISLDEPVDRVPEPAEPGLGRRAAAARREVLASMAASDEGDAAAVGVPGAEAFPRAASGREGPRRMTAEVVFQTLLEECLKDGKLSPLEMRALTNLRGRLGLDLAGHEAMLRKVQEQLARSAPETTEDLDPLVLFERLCWQAVDDDVVDPEEREILGTVARYLHVTAEEYEVIRGRIDARRRRA